MWPQGARSLDLVTGRINGIAPGQVVVAAAGGRRVFVAWTGTDLVEVPAGRTGPVRQLTAPAGWYLAGNGGTIGGGPGNTGAVGDALIVQNSDGQGDPQPATLGLWQPGSSRVRVLGRVASGDYGVHGTATGPGSRSGLVAWIPASCGVIPPWRCIRITNTATMAGRTVRSPTRYGFTLGGALSADGRYRLAPLPAPGRFVL
jgi:hypothetical protein